MPLVPQVEAGNKHKYLTDLTVSDLTDDKATRVVEELENEPILKALSIIRTSTKSGVKIILEAVQEHYYINILHLEGNGIDDELAPAIAEMLKKTNSLTDLILKDCGLSDKSAGLIAEGIKANHTLENLKIDLNAFPQGFEQIKQASKERNVNLL